MAATAPVPPTLPASAASAAASATTATEAGQATNRGYSKSMVAAGTQGGVSRATLGLRSPPGPSGSGGAGPGRRPSAARGLVVEEESDDGSWVDTEGSGADGDALEDGEDAADSNFPEWELDDRVHMCVSCGNVFTLFRRKQ